ncbi:MAG TPA: ABC transporter ATP-binding protein [Candidatus Doudnabacteria bacterium]|nr:ABC transporter ATP-binding protein [Candidatus Doudnabacteria bacterium]
MNLLWGYLKNYKGLLSGALILATINQVFSLLDPQIFRILIDRYANRFAELTAQEYFEGVILLLVGIMGVALVSRIAKTFQDYYINVITQRLGAKLYNDSVTHSFSLPYAVFEDQRSGEFLSKLQDARKDSQRLIQQFINIAFLTLVGVIFVLIYAFIVHWQIGLTLLVMIPVLGYITFRLTRKIKEAQKEIVTETQALAGSTTETLRNVELVKSLGLEGQEIDRLNKTNDKILQLELKKVRIVRTYSFLQGTLINGFRMGLILLLLWLIFTNEVTLGQFFTLLLYSFFVFGPLSELGNVATTYQEAKVSLAKLEEVLAKEKEPVPENAVRLNRIDKIKFDNVSFGYQTGNEEAISNLDLEIDRGKTVAFVGPSGSGKSTTIKLIVGLYQATKGKVIYNDTPDEKVDFIALRNRLGLVAQETQLFAGTIRENLLFVRPEATDAECIEALKSASADSLLSRSGEGLDTIIGEGGLKLSGGEKQRLAIARALLRNPDILIFDEATSSLDSITEESITNTIKEIEKTHPDLIKILVAHRLSTVIHADTIYVLEKGSLIEQGTHEELLKQNGLYSALWRQQIASK